MSEARRRLMDFAARAVAAARTAAAAARPGREAEEPEEHEHDAAQVPPPVAAAASAGDDPNAPDERDETIARLERELEAERAARAELEDAVKALEFKLDVLERSYGKQLADAREAGDAAQQELSELKVLLAETTQELKQVTAVRDRLRDMYSFDGRRMPPELREQRQPGDEDTIARLIAGAGAIAEPGSPPREVPQEPAAAEPEPGELLSPELVFDPGEGSDDEDDEHSAARI